MIRHNQINRHVTFGYEWNKMSHYFQTRSLTTREGTMVIDVKRQVKTMNNDDIAPSSSKERLEVTFELPCEPITKIFESAQVR